MTPILQVVLVGLGTLAMRSLGVTVLADRKIPDTLQRGLRLVAPAVLAGIVVQTLLLEDGSFRALGAWHIAAALAAVVAWATRSIPYTLVAGIGVLWLAEALI